MAVIAVSHLRGLRSIVEAARARCVRQCRPFQVKQLQQHQQLRRDGTAVGRTSPK